MARCAPAVPCGRATDAFLQTQGGTLGRTTDEPNVRSVLTKVATGEVDAGFVYHSDAVATDQVVEIPLANAPVVTVTLAHLTSDPTAVDLGHYLVSDEVAGLFANLGFESVPVGTEAAKR